MIDSSKVDLTDEEKLTFDISGGALEAAAGAVGSSKPMQKKRSVCSRAATRLFHHFIWWRRAPQIRRIWVLCPDFRTLRIVAVPRTRLEIA